MFDKKFSTSAPRIRFGEPYSLPLPEELLPPDYLMVPRPQNDYLRRRPFQVYVTKRAYLRMLDHLRANPKIEQGGVLIGQAFKALDDPTISYVVVVNAVGQSGRSRSISHFTVGPEDIAASRSYVERYYPGHAVVGWFHSHPGHGVFLSGQDMAIVRGIYNADWQVAYVRDTLREEEAFFVGPEGERLGGHLLLLGETLPTVQAAALYQRARDGLRRGDKEPLDALRDLIRRESLLSHWEELGRYQDLQLEPERPTEADEKVPPVSVAPPVDELTGRIIVHPSEVVVADTTREPPSREEREDLDRMYKQAKQYEKSDNPSSALGLYREINERRLGYRDVDERIEALQKEEERGRRPAPLQDGWRPGKSRQRPNGEA